MKQTTSVISTYSADTFGVCSALFELGGLLVMHDPSGCNSTYTTHDEPRWYDTDSMIYISGLTEIDAIMGNDSKLIHDVVMTARELEPRFTAVAGTPIPLMMGTDFTAIARVIEEETGLPSFGFFTNGMHSYIPGAASAFEVLARRMVQKPEISWQAGMPLRINILGVTPLDFGLNGSEVSLKKILEEQGFDVLGVWAMGSTLEDISHAGEADVNLVVSSTGLRAARELYRQFGTPYVVGTPLGRAGRNRIAADLRHAFQTGTSFCSFGRRGEGKAPVTIIGEYVNSASLAAALTAETGKSVRVICPLELEGLIMDGHDVSGVDEAEIIPLLKDDTVLIADPLYRPVCPAETKFIALPHAAFSGRAYLQDIPNLIRDFDEWKQRI